MRRRAANQITYLQVICARAIILSSRSLSVPDTRRWPYVSIDLYRNVERIQAPRRIQTTLMYLLSRMNWNCSGRSATWSEKKSVMTRTATTAGVPNAAITRSSIFDSVVSAFLRNHPTIPYIAMAMINPAITTMRASRFPLIPKSVSVAISVPLCSR